MVNYVVSVNLTKTARFDGSRPFRIPSTKDGEGGLARACAMEAA